MFYLWNYNVVSIIAKMNIYDFDKTIYDGDSSIDFFKYCLTKNKKCIIVVLKTIIDILLYKLKIIKKEKLKSTFFSILKYFDDPELIVIEFWKEKQYKLKDFYLKQKKDTDIIISASPEFLLKPVADKYNFKLIATKVNIKTGKLLTKNCHGEEKVKRLNEIGITECNNFYSDSLSDTPLSNIAKHSYIVKNNTIINWEEYPKK